MRRREHCMTMVLIEPRPDYVSCIIRLHQKPKDTGENPTSIHNEGRSTKVTTSAEPCCKGDAQDTTWESPDTSVTRARCSGVMEL